MKGRYTAVLIVSVLETYWKLIGFAKEIGSEREILATKG